MNITQFLPDNLSFTFYSPTAGIVFGTQWDLIHSLFNDSIHE